ncbi:MAG: DUF4114 domain-containing protein [Rivularia sp. (in: Bacteria)]|nr:DUF4114 domain-containing protein [Rivularia sp. MS3]
MIFNSSEDSFDAGNSLDSIFSASPFPQNATDYSTALNTNNYFQADSVSPVMDDAIMDTQPQNDTTPEPPFNLGFYTVGDTGKLSFDYLLNGGAYQGTLGIFSLAGLGQYEIGSEAFIKETARRSLSNSPLGHIVISEQTEAARYTTEDADYTTGKYEGIKTFEMNPGDQFGVMLIPDGTVEEVLENPGIIGSKQPIFSMDAANPQTGSYLGRVKDFEESGSIWAMEDTLSDENANKEFNDFVFYVQGANGNAPSLNTLLNPDSQWLGEDAAKQILEWQPLPTDSSGEAIQNGDLVEADDKTYLIESGEKRWITNPGIFQAQGFNRDDIKTIAADNLNKISRGDNLPIPSKYQQSSDTSKEWISDFYWWNGDGKPSTEFYKDSNNKFATLNLGSNSQDEEKGIKFDWGEGSILNEDSLLKDNFAVRSYTQANFDQGKEYKVKVRADDGYQLFAKNITTNEWVYITPENEWKTDAYGAHKEIEFEVDESGVYDVHFHYFEGGGDAYFDLSWEEINTYKYMPELASLSEQQWDKYSGESAQYGKYEAFTEGDFEQEDMPDNVLKVYEDLSTAIFGNARQVNSGYAYDGSYYFLGGIGAHAGIDIASINDTDSIRSAINGKVVKSLIDRDDKNHWVAIDETDSNGDAVGRRWWFGHLSQPNVGVGDTVTAGETEIAKAGIQAHLHLSVVFPTSNPINFKEAFNGEGNGSYDADVENLLDRTMSPLQAYWLSRNETINPNPISYFTGKVDSETLNIRTSPSVKANVSNEPLQLGNDVNFDAWANGGKYQLPNGEIKDEWYRIKGTSDWVAGAYIDSRPNQNISELELSSDNFAEALNFTLEREGGYVNDPDDPGGATNKGITQSTYNQYRTSLGLETSDVKSITDEEVSDIYFDSYWLASSSEELLTKLSIAHFDASVNHGVGKAKEMLEEAQASGGDEMNQVNKYLDIREDYYYYLVEQNPKNQKFLQGWLNRVNALRDFLA